MTNDLRDALNVAAGGLDEALDLARGHGPSPQAEGPAFFSGPRRPWWHRGGVEEQTLKFTAVSMVVGIIAVLVAAAGIPVAVWLAGRL